MKKIYITPDLTAIKLHQQLLYAVSGENQEGEGWGGNYAKESNLDTELVEEDMAKNTFIINW